MTSCQCTRNGWVYTRVSGNLWEDNMKEIKAEIMINSAPEKVWSVLTDFENYPRWNLFITDISGRKTIGSSLKVSINPPGGKGMTFKPVLLKFEENKEFRWKGKLFIKGIFDGEHYFILSSEDGSKTKLIQGEKFSGILVGLLGKTLDKTKDGRLIDRIKGLRRQFASSHGIIIPSIHIRDNLKLQAEEYVFSIKGSEVGRYTIHVDKLLAMAPEGVDTNLIKGVKTKEPAFNLDAVWINPNDKNRAEALGFTIVDTATVISTHLTELIRKNAHKLIGRQEVGKLLDVFGKTNPKLVEEVVLNLLSLGEIVTVIKNLLYEEVPVKDLQSILETLADNVHKTKNIDILTEFVRQSLAGYITNQFSVDKTLYTLLLDPKLEAMIKESMQSNKGGDLTLNLSPQKTEAMVQDLTEAMAYFENFNSNPIILVTPEIRKALKNYLDRFIQGYTILSYSEISSNIEIKSIATLD